MNNALFYLSHTPFEHLTDAERRHLSDNSKISYLGDGQLPSDWQADFFVIIKGKLKQYQNDELIAGLHAGDWFFGKDGKFVISEQTLLYRFDGNAIDSVAKQNQAFYDVLFADLSAKQALKTQKDDFTQTQNLLATPIGSLHDYIIPPNFINHKQTLYDATCAMNKAHTKHILVKGKSDIGMFTQADVCVAIGDRADFDSVCVGSYSHFPIQSIHAEQDVSQALIAMLANHIHRLPIVDDNNKIIGVIGQTQLLQFLSSHTQIIFAKIKDAKTIDELSVAVGLIGNYIRRQANQGVKVQVIGRVVQSLNIQVFSKLWSLLVPKAVFDNTCVFVMGSEGRGEQIMRTDQDNALIIDDNFYHDKLDDFANTFNEHLEMFGYPLCRGNMMMRCAVWRLPLSKFQAQIKSWYTTPQDDSLIWLSTLLDAQFVCGKKILFDRLYASIFDNYFKLHSSNFINRFALPVIQMGDQTTFWQKFTGEKDSDIDLKKAGIFPIVHGTKTLCLQHNIRQNTTKERLYWLAKMGVIDESLAKNSLEALNFFLTKRLQVALTTSDKSARRVNPNTLSNLERDLLKQSLQVVKTFKGFMVHYYRLDIFGSS